MSVLITLAVGMIIGVGISLIAVVILSEHKKD